MELRVLHSFLTLVREKSITGAANALHLSQPALSKQLKQLEDELGVVLFLRGNREIELTDEGRYLANRGQEILELVDKTLNNLSSEESVTGTITIGGGETEAMSIIGKAVKKMKQQHPDVTIHLYSGNGDAVSEMLDNGLLDFGLVIDPVEKQRYDYLKLNEINQWGLMVREDHPLAKQQQITADDLQDIPLLIPDQTLVDNRIAEWAGKSLAHYQLVGTYNLLYNASLMVKEGLASALCIDGIINTSGSTLAFIPLEPPLISQLNIIWRKDHLLSKAAAVFLKNLTSVIEGPLAADSTR